MSAMLDSILRTNISAKVYSVETTYYGIVKVDKNLTYEPLGARDFSTCSS